jgi:hypothetical protein
MQYLHMGLKMSTIVLIDCVTFAYYMCSQFKIHLYVNIAHVTFNMWFWHNTNVGIAFEGSNSTYYKHGITNVSFGMILNASIRYRVINTTCNTCLVFHFTIFLNESITYFVMSTTC